MSWSLTWPSVALSTYPDGNSTPNVVAFCHRAPDAAAYRTFRICLAVRPYRVRGSSSLTGPWTNCPSARILHHRLARPATVTAVDGTLTPLTRLSSRPPYPASPQPAADGLPTA